MAVTLDGLEVDLPKSWSETLMAQAFEDSVIGKLTTQKPIPTDGEVIPIYDGGFEAGYVPEGTPKPVSDVGLSVQSITPKKFAGIVLVSKELARRNPAQILEYIRQDMINGASRQIDYAVMYGKSARSGEVVPETTSINATTARVTATDKVRDDLLAAYDLASSEKYDPSGFALDTRQRIKVLQANQSADARTDGFIPNLNAAVASFAGLPAAFGRTVSGRVGTQADTGVLGFTGDFNSGLRWGYSANITMSRSTEATVVDGAGKTWHLWQDNMIGLLMEFEIGWYVNPAAFAAVEAGTAGA